MNLLVRISEPVRLPARTQMAVKTWFEPPVCKDTFSGGANQRSTGKTWRVPGERLGTTYTKDLRWTVNHGQYQLPWYFADTRWQWARLSITDCEIHGLEDEDLMKTRLVVATSNGRWESQTSRIELEHRPKFKFGGTKAVSCFVNFVTSSLRACQN